MGVRRGRHSRQPGWKQRSSAVDIPTKNASITCSRCGRILACRPCTSKCRSLHQPLAARLTRSDLDPGTRRSPPLLSGSTGMRKRKKQAIWRLPLPRSAPMFAHPCSQRGRRKKPETSGSACGFACFTATASSACYAEIIRRETRNAFCTSITSHRGQKAERLRKKICGHCAQPAMSDAAIALPIERQKRPCSQTVRRRRRALPCSVVAALNFTAAALTSRTRQHKRQDIVLFGGFRAIESSHRHPSVLDTGLRIGFGEVQKWVVIGKLPPFLQCQKDVCERPHLRADRSSPELTGEGPVEGGGVQRLTHSLHTAMGKSSIQNRVSRAVGLAIF